MSSLPRLAGFVTRHPLISFFLFAYLFSWVSFFALGGPFLFPFGSIVAAIVVAYVSGGKKALRDLLERCTRWRVSWIWYVLALVVPIVLGVGAIYLVVAVNRAEPPPFAAPGAAMLLLFPMAVVDAPLWEDAGWRGFAMPRFPANRSRVANTATLGLLLAGWHLPIALSGGPVAAPYVITTFLSAFVTNWIYYNSRQSALLTIIYHGAANALGAALFQGHPEQVLVWLYWGLAATNLAATILILVLGANTWFSKAQHS